MEEGWQRLDGPQDLKYLLSGLRQKKRVLIPVLGEEWNPTVVSPGRKQTSFGEPHGHGDLYRGWGGLCKEMLTHGLKNGGSYHTDFQGGREQQV